MVLPLQGYQQTSPTIQEEVGRIAKGSIVEVKLKLKGARKVAGRLGEVTAEGFEVQVAQGQKVDNVKVLYADAKSIDEKPQNRGAHPVAWVLAGVGLIFLIGLVACAAGGCSN